MKDTQNEIKQNIQGTDSDRKETRIQSNDLEQKKKINNQNRMKKQEFKKAKSLINLWDNLKHPNISIIGLPEGKRQQQEIKKLFKQIMKENFPSLAPPAQAAKQGGLPCPGEYLRPRPLTTHQLCQNKEIWRKWKNRV